MIVKIIKNCQIVKNVKTVQKSVKIVPRKLTLSKIVKIVDQVISSHLFDQMSQRSQVSGVTVIVGIKSVTDSVTQ